MMINDVVYAAGLVVVMVAGKRYCTFPSLLLSYLIMGWKF